MKTLYLECNMGAAGDMLAAALLELHPEPAAFIERLNRLALPGVMFRAEPAVKCGVAGTRLAVTVQGREEESEDLRPGESQTHRHPASEHGHAHRSLADIERLAAQLPVPPPVRENVQAVYRLIAAAEGRVHGRPATQVHFHEVGSLDAVADVTAVCLLLHELAPQRIMASPIAVGGGWVRCAHGVLPVPAPATAWLLQGLPTYSGEAKGELCTPTGAALLKHFVGEFGPQPVMRVENIGYGCGKKDFPQANCVRAMLGESGEERGDSVAELRCNLDDLSPEAVAFAMERLFAAGALDVFTVPIGMKKNRPGILLSCLCRVEQREEMARLLFLHTSTLGVRETVCSRYTLDRTVETVETAYGPVRVKRVSGWGAERKKVEYEDLSRIAREYGLSLAQAEERLTLK